MATVPATETTHAISPFPVHRFTVEQYRQLGVVGVLSEADRVELLEGWIVPKTNLNPRHSATVQIASDIIRDALQPNWSVRVQDVVTTSDSEPEPDLAVVRGSQRDYAEAHPKPADIGMVVEVADTSLWRDRYKRRVYGKASVPVYWIINLVDQRVEVYTGPTGVDADPGYRRRDDYGPNDKVPLMIDGQVIAQVSAGELLL